jgi:hypothetical protein
MTLPYAVWRSSNRPHASPSRLLRAARGTSCLPLVTVVDAAPLGLATGAPSMVPEDYRGRVLGTAPLDRAEVACKSLWHHSRAHHSLHYSLACLPTRTSGWTRTEPRLVPLSRSGSHGQDPGCLGPSGSVCFGSEPQTARIQPTSRHRTCSRPSQAVDLRTLGPADQDFQCWAARASVRRCIGMLKNN